MNRLYFLLLTAILILLALLDESYKNLEKVKQLHQATSDSLVNYRNQLHPIKVPNK
jgi:hypothetical protein